MLKSTILNMHRDYIGLFQVLAHLFRYFLFGISYSFILYEKFEFIVENVCYLI
uniref:Uncharacterized protein n=1 Tax=Rhizophora mucronata TaxID=61149 RepID=A0A2P2MZL7_RHIMU